MAEAKTVSQLFTADIVKVFESVREAPVKNRFKDGKSFNDSGRFDIAIYASDLPKAVVDVFKNTDRVGVLKIVTACLKGIYIERRNGNQALAKAKAEADEAKAEADEAKKAKAKAEAELAQLKRKRQ